MDCGQQLSAGADRQQGCGLRDLWRGDGYLGVGIACLHVFPPSEVRTGGEKDVCVQLLLLKGVAN